MKSSFRLVVWWLFAAFLPTVLPAADVGLAVVAKAQRFVQEEAAAPTLSMEEQSPFEIQMFVDRQTTTSVSSASVAIPGGGVRMLLEDFDEFVLEFAEEADVKPDLDATYSNGVYTITMNTQNDGVRVVPVTFPPADAYPNPPRVANFAAAQAVNAAGDFTLMWDAFAGGTANDFIEVTVLDVATSQSVFESSGPGEPGALTGLSNSVVIAGGTLQQGRQYEVAVLFARLVNVDTTTYPGVPVVAAFTTDTEFTLRTLPVGDVTPPQLEDVSPNQNRFPQSGRVVVVFEFDEPMNTALSVTNSIAWSSNVTAASFSYSWDAAARRLFCVYPPGFPTNAMVTWGLNGALTPMNVRDAAGNPLATSDGQFFVGPETGAGDPDVEFFDLVKARLFRQTNAAGAQPLEQYFFFLATDLLTFNGVTNGAVTLPNALQVIPELEGDIYDAEAAYASQAQLDSFFPNGSYQVRFDTVSDGTRTFNFILTGDQYPNAPVVTNFVAAQTINPGNSFVIGWAPFAGGTAGDFIAVEINTADDQENGVFDTPGPGEVGALTGLATSLTIPAYTLAPGRRYQVQVLFAKILGLDTTTYPDVIGVVGYVSGTIVEIQTTGEMIQPTLDIARLPDASLQLTLVGERNRNYSVDTRATLTNGWQPYFTQWVNGPTNSFTGTNVILEPNGFFGTSRFFRAREGF